MTKQIASILFALLLPGFAMATTYVLPPAGNDVIGETFTIKIQKGDTFSRIAKQYDLSMFELKEANPTVKQNRLRIGQEIVIPHQFVLPPYRDGIVINIPELRLYYFPKGQNTVMTYPVALGRTGWRTPTSSTSIIKKTENPVWNVPKSIREHTLKKTGRLLPKTVKPGPENPLGPYAMYLGVSGYLIHGNNNPNSIGKLVSSGCIRMHNQDIEELFYQTDLHTRVKIIHHPIKVGWLNGQLYLESHVPVTHDEPESALNSTHLHETIQKKIKGRHANVNWNKAEVVSHMRHGIPQIIGNNGSDQANYHLPLPKQHRDVPNEKVHGYNDEIEFSDDFEKRVSWGDDDL